MDSRISNSASRTSALDGWSGVEWSETSLHGVHGVVAKGVPRWCQFWRCIIREKHVIRSIVKVSSSSMPLSLIPTRT
jgi:hypothetical protein